MNKEFKYKSNIIYKYSPILLMIGVTYVYLASLYVFFTERDFLQVLTYTLFMIFFIYFFLYLFRVHFLRLPVLVVTDQGVEFLSPLGLKVVPFSDITKIEMRSTMFITFLFISSESYSPLSIRLNRFEDGADDVKDYVLKHYEAYKQLNE